MLVKDLPPPGPPPQLQPAHNLCSPCSKNLPCQQPRCTPLSPLAWQAWQTPPWPLPPHHRTGCLLLQGRMAAWLRRLPQALPLPLCLRTAGVLPKGVQQGRW